MNATSFTMKIKISACSAEPSQKFCGSWSTQTNRVSSMQDVA